MMIIIQFFDGNGNNRRVEKMVVRGNSVRDCIRKMVRMLKERGVY